MPWLCLSTLPMKYNLWPSSVDVLPKFFCCAAVPCRDLRCSSGTCSSHKLWQFFQFTCHSQGNSHVPGANGDIIPDKYVDSCYASRILLTSILMCNRRWGPFWPDDDRSGMGWEMVVISCGVPWAKKAWRSPTFSKPGLGSKFLLLDELPAKDKEPELSEPDILQVTWSFKWT